MKTIKNYFSFLFVLSLLLTSCSKDEAVQDVSSDEVAVLTFGSVLNAMVNKAAAKQAENGDLPACSDDEPAYAQISLTYGDADVVVNATVPINWDDEGYFTTYSDLLAIPVPSDEDWVTVDLRSFEVFSADDVLIWKAPFDGSEFAGFVDDALPMTFDLRAGSKNYVDVEVLCFNERDVNKYGYQFFNIMPEELRTLCFFANYCTDEGRHFTADYSLDLYYYRGEDMEGTPDASELDILYSDRSPEPGVDNGTFYTDPLCIAIPEPQMGEGPNEPYLYYEVTLTEWNDNYPFPEDAVVQTGYLSWNDIVDLLDTDSDGDIENNSDANYWHIQLNCGENDGPPPVEDDDIDNDNIPDTIDVCDDTPPGAEVYQEGDRIGCTVDEETGGGDVCPPAAGEGCVQLVYTDQELNLPPPGGDVQIPAIPLIVNGTNYGEARWDIQEDQDGTFDLVVTFNLDGDYHITATEVTLNDYISTSADESERTVCLSGLNESTYELIIEDLGITGETFDITDFYPLNFDLVANICE